MKTITIKIPSQKTLFQESYALCVADSRKRWIKGCLGESGKDRGVYIMRLKGRVLYVGKTGGERMNYKTRLYRHFVKSAAMNKGIYLKLAKLKQPVSVSFLPDREILKLITGTNMNRQRLEDEVICLMEAAVIHEYKPRFQQKNLDARSDSSTARRKAP